ncbi:RNA polymerase sigma factor SigF [Nocardia sp. NPDC006630]|uniref:RNA polymerase sigma factor SigF n=1 Tax=Nocardia sp. NPDC006630 TaxID=3157181 RepID=UPI0033B668E5
MSTATFQPGEPRQTRSNGDSYDNIEPWFEKLAALPAADPNRDSVREHIIELCLPLAAHIARRYDGRGEAYDDLHQIACVGLVQAVDRFDASRGSTFLSFAIPTIMGEVRRHFRDRTWALRVPRRAKELQQQLGPVTEVLAHRLGRFPTAREIAAELDVDVTEVTQAMVARNAYQAGSLDTPRTGSNDSALRPIAETLGTVEPCYRLLEDSMSVRPLLAALPPADRQLLVWRFFENLTQSQIAERLGVSQMQVSRKLARVLSVLREQALDQGSTALDQIRVA